MANNNKQEIPGMDLNVKKYSNQKPIMPENPKEVQKKMEKTKKELEKLKTYIIKKYPFTLSIGILPQPIIKQFIEEEEVPKETEQYVHLYMIVPEKKFKEIPKIQQDIIKKIDSTKTDQKVWLQVKTPIDVWETSMDSKFELFSGIAMSYPLHDKGLLESIRTAEIHKSLVLQKFDKYVVSYVMVGSFIRGDALKTSDVDVFIVINDTDVKRMPRLELKERLRAMIYQYIPEAIAMAGAKINIHPQVFLLTEFWESVKDANPVIFTFIRDGIPIHDRGTFMPWKALLRMGKLKPSPESIDMFMSMGDRTVVSAKRALLNIVINDIYWGVLTPTQGLLMLYGLTPPNARETIKEMKRVFLEKEKMIGKKYVDILEKIVSIYKDFEHEKITSLKGVEVDQLIKDTEEYLKKLKEIRIEIEKRAQRRTIDEVYKEIFTLLKTTLGNKSEKELVKEVRDNLVKKGKLSQSSLIALENVIKVKEKFKKGKAEKKEIEDTRKDARIFINQLTEYSQRIDLALLDKSRMILKYDFRGEEKIAELINTEKESFLFVDSLIKKLTNKAEDVNITYVNEAIEKQKERKNIVINPKVFELVKEFIGNFEIVL